MKSYMFPVYNPITDTWLMVNGDGTFKEITNEEYTKTRQKMFRTRYDPEN